MDGWTKDDLWWQSDMGYEWLTAIFAAIETTGRWPAGLTTARAVFLCKDPQDTGNPKAYRILKITSAIYRVWATARVRDLDPWIRTWADTAMFAGVPGAGAEEA